MRSHYLFQTTGQFYGFFFSGPSFALGDEKDNSGVTLLLGLVNQRKQGGQKG